MKAIYQYTTSQDYLRSLYENSKRQSPRLTLETYAEKVGIGSSNLKMIINGKRNLSLKNALKIAKFHKLSFSETEYLQTIVLKSASKDTQVKRFVGTRVKHLKEVHSVTSFPISGKDVLADPYTLPILVYFKDILEKSERVIPLRAETLELASARLGISPDRISKSLKILLKLEILSRSEEDECVHYVFGNFKSSLSQQQYIEFWLDETLKKMKSDFNHPSCFFNSSLITIEEKLVPEFERELKSVFEKYISQPDTDGPKTLVQAGVQVFPILRN